MASSTRSAGHSFSVPGTSVSLPSLNWTCAVRSALTLPLSPTNSLVETANSRAAPSSWLDEVRSLIGQYGHTSGLFSCSGGMGITSNCVTLLAPWRLLVPTQSLPVSPPPMTMTCLPLALMASFSLSPALARFCCGNSSMAKCTPSSSRPGTGRSRDCSAPPVSSTASKSCVSCAADTVSFARLVTLAPGPSPGMPPTSTPVRIVTPSACICSTRRSMCALSSLKSGMP